MRKVIWLLLALFGTAPGVMAGPNDGGVIWVHNTGIMFSSDLPLPPVSAKPSACTGVDTQQPADNVDRIWKVYAAFPAGSSPRLKTAGWGIEFPDANSSPYAYVTMNAAGCGSPDEDGPGTDFWIGDRGFPTASGGQVGQSFLRARLASVVTLFYFAGAGYIYPGTGLFPIWSAVPHGAPGNRIFGDDAFPSNVDPIMGYGSLGFGIPGTAPCPVSDPSAACCAPSSACAITKQADCPAPNSWHVTWYTCAPNPCPLPPGACCYADGRCEATQEQACLDSQGIYLGGSIPCSPNPCPTAAACCLPSGTCLVRTEAACATLNPPGVWHPGTESCDPNPCPQIPVGACCTEAGSCAVTQETSCPWPRVWHGDWPACTPNPCPQPPPEGACCDPVTSTCTITTEAACLFQWIGAGTVCNVTTCPPSGSFDLAAPASAAPGELISVSVIGHNSTSLAGYGINVTFDPAVFEFVGSTLAGTRGEGAAMFTPGHTDSAARAGVVFDFDCHPGIPVGTGSMLLVTLRVKPGAPAGGTDMIFQDQAPSLNRMSPCGGGTLVPSLSSRTVQVLPLPTGACCNPTTGACTITTPAGCSFTWLGPGVDCNTVTCPVPPATPGACCFRNAYCRILPAARCLTLRGVFVGGVCTPSIDPPCSVQGRKSGDTPPDDSAPAGTKNSWGQIKNRYR